MAYYHICPHCGAALDPGERCDCEEKRQPERAKGKVMRCTYPTTMTCSSSTRGTRNA